MKSINIYKITLFFSGQTKVDALANFEMNLPDSLTGQMKAKDLIFVKKEKIE